MKKETMKEYWNTVNKERDKEMKEVEEALQEAIAENTCYKCDIEIDEEDTICCNCIDDTDGRNQHFWKIKDEEE